MRRCELAKSHRAVHLGQDVPQAAFFSDEGGVDFQPAVELGPLRLTDVLRNPRPLALYVHIPFCEARCSYCACHAITGRTVTDELVTRYVDGLVAEMALYSTLLAPYNVRIQAVHVGGGTPSMLIPTQLDVVLRSIRANFEGDEAREITVEVFPSSVTDEKARVLARSGSARLNIGVQTFDDEILALVGRQQTRADVFRAVETAHRVGIKSVGVDFICGLPGSNPATVLADLEIVPDLRIDHVTVYPLWLYPGTALCRSVTRGQVSVPDLIERKALLGLAESCLTRAGFVRYSAFHFRRTGSREHLYARWQMENREWIGIGAAAYSDCMGFVYGNTHHVGDYIRRSLSGLGCVDAGRALGQTERMARTLAYGIRLFPFPSSHFRDVFGCSVEQVFEDKIQTMRDRGLVEICGDLMSLTLDGVLRLPQIERFLQELPRVTRGERRQGGHSSG